MNAPDKIYVFQHGINAFDPLWHFTESKEKYTESHEYIRKDALLEWANGKMTIEGATEGIIGGYDLALKDLINHIESL